MDSSLAKTTSKDRCGQLIITMAQRGREKERGRGTGREREEGREREGVRERERERERERVHLRKVQTRFEGGQSPQTPHVDQSRPYCMNHHGESG